MCRDGRRQQGGGAAGAGEAQGHWALVAGAVGCVWAAALAKEIGITVVGTAVLLDLYLVPFAAQQPPPGAERGCARAPDDPGCMHSLSAESCRR